MKISKKIKTAVSMILIICILCGIIVPAALYFNKGSRVELSDEQRENMLMRYTPLDFSPKAENMRITIDNDNPVHFIPYYQGMDEIKKSYDAIPDDLKPMSVFIIFSLSEEYSEFLEENKIPFVLMIGSGETLKENQMPLQKVDKLMSNPYMLGVGLSEIYNCEQWRGEMDGDISLYIAGIIALMHKHGGIFLWKDTNIFGDNGNLIDWIEENEFLYTLMQENYKNIYFLNKESYGDPSTYSLLKGLYMAKLIGGWGVSTDWWHWQVDHKKALFSHNGQYIDNEWERIYYYPENMQTMSLMMALANGATCFANEASFYAFAITETRLANYQFVTIPFLRNVKSGLYDIPSRQQLLETEKFAIVGGKNYKAVNYNLRESNLYPSRPDFGIIPLLPANLRSSEQAYFNENNIKLINHSYNLNDVLQYASGNTGDTYMQTFGTQTLYINNMENKDITKTASVPQMAYSNISDYKVTASPHTFVHASQSSDKIIITANNYRIDKDEMVKTLSGDGDPFVDVKNWLGVSEDGTIKADDSKKRQTVIEFCCDTKPAIISSLDQNGGEFYRPYSYSESYDSSTKKYVLTIEHNGYVEFEIQLCEGNPNKSFQKEKVENYNTQVLDDYDYTEINKILEEKSEIFNNPYDYTFASYHEFLQLYTKLQTAVEENNLTQSEIKKITQKLNDLKMIDVTDSIELLKSIDTDSASEQELNAYDDLLLSIMSPTRIYYNKYKSGKIRVRIINRRNKYTFFLALEKSNEIERYHKRLSDITNH
ncbi:MAG: glycoside hydrolase family 98 domain-containing protein [Eubacterium sp.]